MPDAKEIIEQAEKASKAPAIRTLREKILSMTVKQIRELCETNPTHPLAIGLASSVKDYPEKLKIGIERSTAIAIAENGEVVTSERIDPETGGQIVEKSVVPRT